MVSVRIKEQVSEVRKKWRNLLLKSRIGSKICKSNFEMLFFFKMEISITTREIGHEIANKKPALEHGQDRTLILYVVNES